MKEESFASYARMINWIALRRRPLRVIAGRKTYQEMCDRQWTLCTSEQFDAPSAIYAEEDLDKITGLQAEATYENEMKRIRGGRVECPATIAYQLKQVHLIEGYLYKGAMKHCLVATPEPFFVSGSTEHFSEVALASTTCGNQYFGHWMTDDLTLALAAQPLAPTIRTAQSLTAHQQDYSAYVGIDPIPVRRAYCEKLFILDDVGQNRFKRERYELIRSRLKQIGQAEADCANQSPWGVMFLRHRSGTKRFLVNEAEIAAFLQGQGFTIIDPEKLSVREIVRQTLGAKIVVGVEGSQLAHGLFSLADGGTILALQPPYRFNNVYKEYADCLGMRYAFAVGQETTGGFEVNLERFAKLLERVSTLDVAAR